METYIFYSAIAFPCLFGKNYSRMETLYAVYKSHDSSSFGKNYSRIVVALLRRTIEGTIEKQLGSDGKAVV